MIFEEWSAIKFLGDEKLKNTWKPIKVMLRLR